MKTTAKVRPSEEKQEKVFSEGYTFIGLLKGRGVSQGTRIGRVTIVKDIDDMAHAEEGAVIVSKTASGYLTIAMSKALAIATEFGGHGAIASKMARTLGIPAVVGVSGLTETVAEGDLVWVDGAKGTVEILEFAS